MMHSLYLVGDKLVHVKDDRDQDQIVEALMSKGYVKITGEQRQAERTHEKPTIFFREHIISITSN